MNILVCANCGTPVGDKYCPRCGRKVISPLKVFRDEENRARRMFVKHCKETVGSHPVYTNLATACWYAAWFRYGKISRDLDVTMPVTKAAYDEIEIVCNHAGRLFDIVMNA